MTELAGIAHVVLRVQDWKRTARWYQDVLGFERRAGTGFSCFVHPSASFAILLRPSDEATEPSSAPTQRLDHLALHVPSVAALEEWKNALAANGVDCEIEHQPTLGASITLFDPDGVEIELFTPESGSVLEVGPR
jgi:catechol 2,3-dioxygenase-like lactoylglutathione lyase family enzyme